MRYLLLVTGILCLSVLPVYSQLNAMTLSQIQLEKATVMAQKSLTDLEQLARLIDVRTTGFDNLEQISKATLGIPVSDYMVRLDELKEYQAGRPALEMLHPTGRLLYPLEVNKITRSAVILRPDQDGWAVESFGSANQINMVTTLRRSLARTTDRAETDLFQVRVPALQLMFIGIEHDGRIYLAPLFDMPAYGLKKGERYPGSQVLEKLVDAARKHNGEPT